MPSLQRQVVFFGLTLLAGVSLAREPLPALGARAVALCDPPQQCAQVGQLRILGLLELPPRTVNGLRVGNLSGLAWDDDEGLLYALSDHGALFTLKPVFRSDRLVDVSLIRAVPLIDPLTKKPVKWQRSDAEGLAIVNGRNGRRGDAELLVSFEHEPRITRYRPGGTFITETPLPALLRDPKRYRGDNKMLESLCLHPREGALTAPEEPLDKETTPRLYRLDGISWRLPTVRGGIVALECLESGDVLLLERDLDVARLRIVITLHRLHLPVGTKPNALLSADAIAVFDSATGLRLDNFEGLAWQRGNRFFLVSDNNSIFLQRTFLLYVEVADRQSD